MVMRLTTIVAFIILPFVLGNPAYERFEILTATSPDGGQGMAAW